MVLSISRGKINLRRQTRINRRSVWWIIVAGIALALIVYLIIPRPPEVRVVNVREGILELFLSSTGVIEGEVSDIGSRVTARIIRLYVREGDEVAQGQVMAQLESTDLQAEVNRAQSAVTAAEQEVASLQSTASTEAGQLRAAAAQARANLQAASANLRQLEAGTRPEDIASQRAVVQQARAQAEDARTRFERAQQLFQRGAIPAQDLDTARANYESASAQVQAQEQVLRGLEAGARAEEIQAARARVRAAEAALREAQSSIGLISARQRDIAAAQARLGQARAGLQNARVQLTYTTIRSPVTGIVARRHKETGEIASQSEAIYTVADLDDIWVIAEVDEEDISAIAPGQEVAITLDAYPGQEAKGVVSRISVIAEPKEVGRVRAKIVRARIDITDSQIPLRPGMEVNVNGTLPVGERTILAPNDAVIRVGDQDSVYVIRNQTTELRPVELGQSNFEFTQVLSGLQEGELVAVDNLDDLRNGMRVRVVH